MNTSSHPDELSYDETLTKHLLSKITIFYDHIVFEFKSGVTVSVVVPNLGNRFSHKIDDADTPKEYRNLIIS